METNHSYYFKYNNNNNHINHFNREILYYILRFYSINYYIKLVTIPIGLIGNLVSIFIFTRRSLNQRTNTGFLYTILCILNLFRILYKTIFKHWNMVDRFTISLHFGIEYLIENLILQFLSWMQAFIGFDRFIVVFSPIKGVRTMNKKLVLFSIIFGLFVFILCANSPYFIRSAEGFEMSDENNTIYAFIKIFMEIYIPYLVIVILDIMVIVRLKRSKTNKSSGSTRRRTSRFTINTILIDLIYLIIYFPTAFMSVFLIINRFKILQSFANLVAFIGLIVQLLPYLFSCYNFFIFIIFNRNFRSEFLSIFSILNINSCFKRNNNLLLILNK